jgi:hypothetical protein
VGPFSERVRMPERNSVRTELEELRCIVEEQQYELARLKRHVEVQFRVSSALQTALDEVQVALPATATRASSQQHHANGNGNGNGHRAAPHLPPSLV